MPELHLNTQAVHAGYEPEKQFGSVSQPLILTTTFERENGVPREHIYTRNENPNRISLETKLAILEGGADAIAFASGQAAAFAVFQAVLEPGAHVLIPDDCYHGIRTLFAQVYQGWQINCEEVDMSVVSHVADAIRPETKLIWIETPTNPKLKIFDIQGIAKVATDKGIPVACDNTWATPFFQRPFELGVDIVMHSTTKYFGGHSDILGGAVILREKGTIAARIRAIQGTGGGVPSPFDCWLLNRSLATFPLRMPVHSSNAQALAQFLHHQAAIERVYYPGLPTHPNHEVAKTQMQGGFGGMLSIEVKGGMEKAIELAENLQIFTHATSLGGVESLIEHRRSAEGLHPRSPDNLLRVSVGIEFVGDLIRDFEQALARL
ncbi:trans-sulfuration enzyme family protein [Haliscomenobacter hydrossis]|uniref:Cys/Met metabolism pyridoxal-phosphate-dependent protein n=1 Tax=Haliscomenobacter hydrossis (strain ATCC 27775 / DSM 1100 / LMG 10767 / O) TaxID=760192 RepID=F4KR15_HALH1|nr:PLP-dependent aspartate aminotransferase family protein [Haliscomenobacter hydrossis]AEE53253.1 Cys/Met metabolism pyridoxal-phosphate-dependent protein [Haliscomenobacter hydrossis DSM 1100]